MIAELPVGVADPVERLEATRRQMDTLKASHQAEASETMYSLAGFAPPMLYAVALRSATAALRRLPQRSVHTVTTNVPGPQYPLYALGREMVEYLPFVPLSQGVRIGVAILSYNGQVRFGVTGDYDTVPEVDWFCRRIEAGIAELTERAGSVKRPSQEGDAGGLSGAVGGSPAVLRSRQPQRPTSWRRRRSFATGPIVSTRPRAPGGYSVAVTPFRQLGGNVVLHMRRIRRGWPRSRHAGDDARRHQRLRGARAAGEAARRPR